MNLFGKKKEAVIQPSQAISKLQETISNMEKRETFLDKQACTLRRQAREFVKTNKPKALFALKRAKLLEKQLESSMGAKFNLEMQIASLIQALNNTETVSALRTGYKALTSLENKIDPDKVVEVMDDITEAMLSVDEVSESISRPIGPVIDDDELLLELESMVDQPAKVKLPSVPETSLPSSGEDEELRELEELDRLMNA